MDRQPEHRKVAARSYVPLHAGPGENAGLQAFIRAVVFSGMEEQSRRGLELEQAFPVSCETARAITTRAIKPDQAWKAMCEAATGP